MIVIEAKSGSTTSLQVPSSQIARCIDWHHIFDIFDNRQVVLAFKFLSKKRLDTNRYQYRAKREYYKIWDTVMDPVNFVCTYDGDTYSLVDGTRFILQLDNCTMPFVS